MAKDIISGWMECNDKAMEKASDLLAVGIIETFIGKVNEIKDEKLLQNATDLQECDRVDIQLFFSLLQKKHEEAYGRGVYSELEAKHYSIKQWSKKEKGYGDVKLLFDAWCEENYEDVLPDEILRAFNERCEVACIVNAQALNGGGYEVKQDLFIAAIEKVAEIIKQQCKQDTLTFNELIGKLQYFSVESNMEKTISDIAEECREFIRKSGFGCLDENTDNEEEAEAWIKENHPEWEKNEHYAWGTILYQPLEFLCESYWNGDVYFAELNIFFYGDYDRGEGVFCVSNN